MNKSGIAAWAAVITLGAMAYTRDAQAQTAAYPARPVRVIVSVPAGGGPDTVGRSITQKMSDRMGQQFVVDNRPGAGGVIGVETAARANPDGYTLLFASGTFLINQLLYKVPYDALRDFAPVSLASESAYVVAVNNSVAAKTLPAFVALAKARPRAINYASPGKGSLVHLTAELISSAAGIEMVHIPYKGMPQAFPDIISGQVHVAISSAITMLPYLRTGRLHALAVTGRTRNTALPEVPTIAESGYAGFEVTQWYGMLAPAKTPLPIRAVLQQEVVRALGESDVRARLTAEGSRPIGSTPDELAQRLKDEHAKWSKTIKAAGIKVD
jgi:tripartite-type tricarboxylate transporter receptor subunit TctC